MSKYKIVFDDLETAAKESANPVMSHLTFGVTFEALDEEAAERISKDVMEDSGGLGRWHLESVKAEE
jgi:hypothetical protein